MLGGSEPALGVLDEFFAVGRRWFDAQKKCLPLDGDSVTEFFGKLIETHGRDVTPRSKEVRPNGQVDGFAWGSAHGRKVMACSRAALIAL